MRVSFFFFVALTASARLSATRSREDSVLDLLASWEGGTVDSGTSITGVSIFFSFERMALGVRPLVVRELLN
jgi:hypothetical protein